MICRDGIERMNGQETTIYNLANEDVADIAKLFSSCASRALLQFRRRAVLRNQQHATRQILRCVVRKTQIEIVHYAVLPEETTAVKAHVAEHAHYLTFVVNPESPTAG